MSEYKTALIHVPNLYIKENALFSEINISAMGLFSLAGEIKKEGIDCEIINLGIEKYLNKNFSLSEYIKENNVKVAAFSLHWHAQSFDTIETIKIIKEKNPEIKIILGGFTSTYFSNEIMGNFPFVDGIIRGEGEIPMRKYMKTVFKTKEEDFSTIPNLVWRNKNGEIITNKEFFVAKDEDLNNFEFFNPEIMKNYESAIKAPFVLEYLKENQLNNAPTSHGICLGRGCMGNCAWCGGGFYSTKILTGRDFISYRSPDKITEEIKILKEKYGIKMFRFAFDPRPDKKDHLFELTEKIKKQFKDKLTVEFASHTLPDKNFLKLFEETFSKDSIITISPEFHSEILRKKYKSFFYTNEEFEDVLDYMEELKINSELYFAKVPESNEEENKKSEEYGEFLSKKYKYVKKYYIFEMVMEPASFWSFHPEKFGLKIKEKKFIDYYNDTKSIIGSFENPKAFNTLDFTNM